MFNWYSAVKTKRQRPVKCVFLTFLTIVAIICLISINNVYAAENDPSDNVDNADTVSSNAVQDQKAENLAEQAALQDPAVTDSYAQAEKTENVDEANALYQEKVDEYNAQIEDMRASGMGWGEIAHELGVHPSVLGMGHSKKAEKQKGFFSKLSSIGSNIKASISRSFKGSKANKDSMAAFSSKNKGYGSTKGQGLAKGHNKDENSGRGGQNGGRGGGNGNGGGGGNGGGRK
jgi:hypothetical protein